MQNISHPHAMNTTQAPELDHPRHTQRGQGMTEYIIIVALIAVAAIAVYQFFGQTIRNQTSGIAREISGETAEGAINNAKAAAAAAEAEGKTKKGLGNYTNDQSRGK